MTTLPKMTAIQVLSAYAEGQRNFYQRDLSGVDLGGQTLRDAHFVECDLRKARFSGADLERATFVSCDAQQASFMLANLRRAEWDGGDWVDARFQDAHLAHARLGSSNPTYFDRADFNGADFEHASLRWGIFNYTNFERATFRGADLRDASFVHAHFLDPVFDQETQFCVNSHDLLAALFYAHRTDGISFDWEQTPAQREANEDTLYARDAAIGQLLVHTELCWRQFARLFARHAPDVVPWFLATMQHYPSLRTETHRAYIGILERMTWEEREDKENEFMAQARETERRERVTALMHPEELPEDRHAYWQRLEDERPVHRGHVINSGCICDACNDRRHWLAREDARDELRRVVAGSPATQDFTRFTQRDGFE